MCCWLMLSEIKSIKYYHAHLISSLRGQKQRLPPCSDSMNENNCGEHCIVNGSKATTYPHLMYYMSTLFEITMVYGTKATTSPPKIILDLLISLLLENAFVWNLMWHICLNCCGLTFDYCAWHRQRLWQYSSPSWATSRRNKV